MRLPLAATALTAAGLTWLTRAHPSVRFVDVIGFSKRAEALSDRLTDPLYPVGYPAFLAAAHALGLDVLTAAKGLTVLASTALVFAASFLTNPAAALWMIAQPGALEWGSTEGTDMPAAALAIGAIAAANARRSHLAGVLLGLACLTRYTSVAAVPVVLMLDRAAWRALLVTVSPHFVLAAWTGTSPMPDQSMNLGIGAGHQTRLLSMDTVLRWPMGFGRALEAALPDWPSRIAALGLVVGIRDRAARGLLAFALLYLAMVALVFSNARLCLPATLALTLGAGWLVPKRFAWVLLFGAALVLFLQRDTLGVQKPGEVERATLAAKCAGLQGLVLSNSPWFYTHRDGWLVGSRQLSGLGQPRELTPAGLAERLRRTDAEAIALDFARVPGAMPGLVPMMKATPPGFVEVARTPSWGVWTLE